MLTIASFRLDAWGLLGILVYLALDEQLIEEIADFLLVELNLGRINISFSSGITQHGVQQILLKLPLFRFRQLMEELM